MLLTSCGVLAATLSGALPVGAAAPGDPTAGPEIAGCAILPADDVWNTPVDGLPVDSSSEAYIATIGADDGFHADFGSGEYEGGPIGIPFVVVAGDPDADGVPLLAHRPLVDGAAAAYVCRGFVCDRPVTTSDELTDALRR